MERRASPSFPPSTPSIQHIQHSRACRFNILSHLFCIMNSCIHLAFTHAAPVVVPPSGRARDIGGRRLWGAGATAEAGASAVRAHARLELELELKRELNRTVFLPRSLPAFP